VKFSSGEKEVIERKLEVSSDSKSNKRDRFEFYEISRCVDVINRRDFQKIALQFPDMLLVDSAAVASMLERDTGKKVFVLADTSYGSCCVDEVAAEHVEADLIIHYGRACLSQTRRLPVLYVFGKWPVDVQSCMEQFQQMFPDPEVSWRLPSNVCVFIPMSYLQSSRMGHLKIMPKTQLAIKHKRIVMMRKQKTTTKTCHKTQKQDIIASLDVSLDFQKTRSWKNGPCFT